MFSPTVMCGKHHAHLLTMEVDVDTFCSDVFTFKQDFTAIWNFQEIQAAKEGTLAAAGWSDDRNNFSFGDMFADTLENLEFAKTFM